MFKFVVPALALLALASCGKGDPARGATFLNLCEEERDTTTIANTNNCDKSTTTSTVEGAEPVE